MNRTLLYLLALTNVLVAACVAGARGPNATAVPTAEGNRPVPAPPTWSSPQGPASPGCYYVWATRELPELSKTLQEAFAQVDGGVRASAYAFGEECRGDDGTITFLPMETDFRLRIPVATLTDEAALGGWISRSMAIVETMPASEAAGTRPGSVEFEFFVDEVSSLRVVVEISRYRAETTGLDGASILRLFRQGP